MSSTSSNGIWAEVVQNISAYPRPMGVFCWAWEREAKAVDSLEFLYHLSTQWCGNSSFCQPFRQGSKLVNWKKSTLGWAEHL